MAQSSAHATSLERGAPALVANVSTPARRCASATCTAVLTTPSASHPAEPSPSCSPSPSCACSCCAERVSGAVRQLVVFQSQPVSRLRCTSKEWSQGAAGSWPAPRIQSMARREQQSKGRKTDLRAVGLRRTRRRDAPLANVRHHGLAPLHPITPSDGAGGRSSGLGGRRSGLGVGRWRGREGACAMIACSTVRPPTHRHTTQPQPASPQQHAARWLALATLPHRMGGRASRVSCRNTR